MARDTGIRGPAPRPPRPATRDRARARGRSRISPTLALLTSALHDGALAPDHLADLRRSGLTDATIKAQLIRSVPCDLLPRLLGFDVPAIRSALLFPFPAPAGGIMDHVRVKVFPPLVGPDGHATKYLGPRGAPPRLYFCVQTLADVLAPDAPVYLVEGAKKALAIAQLALPAVGFEGIEGWHARGTADLLPDFAAIPLRDRIVDIVPDGDWETNPAVSRGLRRLFAALRTAGARPRVVVIPRAPTAESRP